MKKYLNCQWWVWCAIVIVALLSIVANFGVWPMCDDIDYGICYNNYYEGNPLYYPRWIIRHWVFSNGRAANFFAPLWLYYLPFSCVRIVSALMIAAMLAMIVRMGCPDWRTKPLRAMTVLCVAAFGLTWWDGMMMFDFAFNYVWASALGLFSVWLIFKRYKNRAVIWLGMTVALIGGMMHESMSAPLAAGLVVWGMLNGEWKNMPRANRAVLISFFAGAFVAFAAPGIWMRATKDFQPDDPVFWLLLKSDYIAIALAVALSVTAIIRPRSLKPLMQGQTCIWIVAAISAMAFSAVGGIVGRSGWFANVYAIIAFAQWVPKCKRQPKLIVALLGLLVVGEYAGIAYWQQKCGKELKDVIDLYQKSPDGTVFYDYTDDREIPWWTLRRTRGVPDSDDYYSLSSLTSAYGDSLRPLSILPTSVKALQPWEVKTTKSLPGNMTATLQCPKDARALGIWYEPDGTEMVVVPYLKNDTVIYILQLRDHDPGDRDYHLLPMGYTPWLKQRLKLLQNGQTTDP